MCKDLSNMYHPFFIVNTTIIITTLEAMLSKLQKNLSQIPSKEYINLFTCFTRDPTKLLLKNEKECFCRYLKHVSAKSAITLGCRYTAAKVEILQESHCSPSITAIIIRVEINPLATTLLGCPLVRISKNFLK